MPKAFTLGNGNMMIGLDQVGQVYDMYFPYIGLENHTAGHHVHKIGVYVDGHLSWIDEDEWTVDITCGNDTMSSNVKAVNDRKKIELTFEDVVYNEKNIFIRRIAIRNLMSTKRTVKLYINHQFEIYEAHRGDTAYYDPERKVLIHYKGRRIFLINADNDKFGIDDYSIGLNGIEGHDGTWRDAEDGQLSQHPVEHGNVDSTVGFTFDIKGNEEHTMHYWMTVAKHMEEAYELNTYVLEKTPTYLMQTTQSYWKAWVNKQNFSFYKLDPKVVTLFKRSLLLVRSHVDNRGAIIASGDSDLLKQGRDYYNYMWPRDGALTAMALNNAGYTHVTKNFFTFCNEVISEEGYLMHKYRADGSLGASWHPWVRNGEKQLPIQEDETALVIHALWQYYVRSKDLEFIESIYNSLVKKAAEFMVRYMDPDTGLPLPSYDLWEEKYGTSTFTSSATYAGLMAASKFAGLLGKSQSELKYRTFAEKVKKSILEKLYDEKEGYFYKLINNVAGKIEIDRTLDMSSIYAIFKFGVLPVTDERVERSIHMIHEKLECKTEIGGIPRYEGDYYFRVSYDVPGNPWIITTLWLAQYYLLRAEKEEDFDMPVKWLDWAVDRALPSGILSEQMNPFTGEQLSASPLTWSHAEFIATVITYLQRLDDLDICDVCYPLESTGQT